MAKADDVLKMIKRLIIIGYFTASIGATSVFLAAYFYARHYDPWLTPRHTHYMYVWWDIGRPMCLVMTLLIPIGVMLAFFIQSLNQRLIIAISIAIMIAIPCFSGVP